MSVRSVYLPRKLISIVGGGFALVLILIFSLVVLGVYQLAASNAHLESVQESRVKSQLVSQMRDILRDRAVSMLTIVVSGDTADKNQEKLRFDQFDAVYQRVRLDLEHRIKQPHEHEVLMRIDSLTRANQPVMVRIVDLALAGYALPAFDALQREGIPLQRALVKELDALIQIQREMSLLAAEAARADYNRTRWWMIGLGALAVLAAAGVAVAVMRRTARLAAATELERSKFQTLFETNSDGIAILDRTGFTDCNPALLDMFHMQCVEDFLKYRPEEMGVEQQPCGTSSYLLAERSIRVAVEQGHAFLQWLAQRPDGTTFPAEIALHAMNICGEPVIQAILRDVSVRKEVEMALEVARDTALRANEMKSQWVANVSHEIRTPMNGILGMTQLLLGSNLNLRQQDYAESIKRSAESLMRIINDLLDFSKIEAGRLEIEHIEFDLVALLKDVLELQLARAQAKKLRLHLIQSENLPRRVYGDPLRVRQILLNLLDNALKFTPAGEVRLEVSWADSPHETLYFVVSDSGIGMDEATQNRVFQAFAQADGSVSRKYGGTGLGLTICRQLAELMGGTLTLESHPGQGSIFQFTLPVSFVYSVETMQLNGGECVENLRFAGVNVLVAEDNLINQKLIRFMLENHGVSVQMVDDGKIAYDLLDTAVFDVVLMDCQMPEWDGLTATRAVRVREVAQGRAHLPIIALTANAMTGYDEICKQAGMDDYLIKPLNEALLVQTLLRWVPDKSMGSDSIDLPKSIESDPIDFIDFEKLRGICRNDPGQINEMLRLFITSMESLLLDLAGVMASRNAVQAARQAHQIKGAAAFMGAVTMAELASETEIHAKALDWSACLAAQEDLEAAFIRVRLAMEAHVI